MTRKTLPRVDEAALSKVLQKIGKESDTRREFVIRGNPANGGFQMRGGHNGVVLRTEELLSCVTDDEHWHPGEAYDDAVAARAVYRHFQEKWTVAQVAQELKERFSLELKKYRVAFDVQGLQQFADPIDVGLGNIGPLSALMGLHGYTINRDFTGGVDAAQTMAVLVELEAPDSDRATRAGAVAADRALDVLALGDLRSMFVTGPPWELRLGRHVWVWEEAEIETGLGMFNTWMRGYNFGFNKDALGPQQRPRLRAPMVAWTSMQPGELAEAMQRAYVSMGSAVRNAYNARTSITQAWSAIETAFTPDSDEGPSQRGERGARVIAVRMQLAVAKDGGTPHPFELVNFYLRRNAIVHEAQPDAWDHSEAKNLLGDQYRHLDELAEFCITTQLGSWKDLAAALEDPEVREKTAGWVKRWQAEVRWFRDNARLDGTRKRYAFSVKLWDQVLWANGHEEDRKPWSARALAWIGKRFR